MACNLVGWGGFWGAAQRQNASTSTVGDGCWDLAWLAIGGGLKRLLEGRIVREQRKGRMRACHY